MFLNRFKFSLIATLLLVLLFALARFVVFPLEADEFDQGWKEFGAYWFAVCLSVIFVAFGGLADWYIYRLEKKALAERLAIYRSTVWASHHVLNNFLNKLYLIQHHALQNGEFTEELSESMGKMIQEAAGQLLVLSRVEPITADGIRESVSPK